MRELCLPVGLAHEDMQQIDDLVASRRKVRKGEALYRSGERFDALFAVRVG
jgi:CRP/FNR family transcriptional regulator